MKRGWQSKEESIKQAVALDLEGKSRDEICQIMGKSRDAVRSYLIGHKTLVMRQREARGRANIKAKDPEAITTIGEQLSKVMGKTDMASWLLCQRKNQCFDFFSGNGSRA